MHGKLIRVIVAVLVLAFERVHRVLMSCAARLLPYDAQFEYGPQLRNALQPVKLNHPHCAKFCVLGGGRCSG